MKIQKILCPVDFSDASKRALEWARALAEAQGAEILLLHVIEPYILPIEYGLAPMPHVELDDQAKKNALGELKTLSEKSLPKIKTQTLVHFGRAAESIVSLAKEKSCDLIVISTHGRTGVSRMFLGSTAERVVRLAPCPVLSVRNKE